MLHEDKKSSFITDISNWNILSNITLYIRCDEFSVVDDVIALLLLHFITKHIHQTGLNKHKRELL